MEWGGVTYWKHPHVCLASSRLVHHDKDSFNSMRVFLEDFFLDFPSDLDLDIGVSHNTVSPSGNQITPVHIRRPEMSND